MTLIQFEVNPILGHLYSVECLCNTEYTYGRYISHVSL